MLTIKDYFGGWINHPDATPQVKQIAQAFLVKVNGLMEEMIAGGVVFPINPTTGTIISGSSYGGFRPKDAPVGSERSSHKEGRGVDLYDPYGLIDTWCYVHPEHCKKWGIYLEHPQVTARWSHWTDRAPPSGRRFFYP